MKIIGGAYTLLAMMLLGITLLAGCQATTTPHITITPILTLTPATPIITPTLEEEPTATSITLPIEGTPCPTPLRLHLHTIPAEGGTVSQFGDVVQASSDPRDKSSRPFIGDLSLKAEGVHTKAFISFDISSIPPDLAILSAKLDLHKYEVLAESKDPFAIMGPLIVEAVHYNGLVQSDSYDHPNTYGTLYSSPGVPDDPIDVTSYLKLAYHESYARFQISIYFTGPPQHDRQLEQVVFDDSVAGVGLDIQECLPDN